MDSPQLERLTAAECRRLLPSAPVGRLVVPTPHFPTVEPVSFAVVEGDVVVAVRAGSAGDAMAAGTQVAFEVDVLDDELRRGWSVVVKGRAEDLAAGSVEPDRRALRPWPASTADRLLVVRPEEITGQRIVNGAPVAPAGDPAVVPAAAPAPSGPAVFARRSIDADEALGLLRAGGEHVGRLAICPGGEPLVFPLNYAVDGDAVIFRTEVGTKLSGITRSLATFEVDHLDASGRGWAISFEGLAQEVLDADPVSLRARIDALRLDAWPGGDRTHVVRITPYGMRGTAWTPVETGAAAAAAANPSAG
jgi:nitroimidazol reductase NimA-like FMN-containing flavoprotein (pyridoxamine 5'-phosphate oxidase superfamily)